MLDDAGLSKKYWAFAVSVTVYLKNCTPMRLVVGKTLYKAWYGRKPFLKHLCVFTCLAIVHVPKEEQKKVDDRATPGIFVGYSILTKEYFVYDPLAKTLLRSRDVVFREEMWYTAPNATDEAILNHHFIEMSSRNPIPQRSNQPNVKRTSHRTIHLRILPSQRRSHEIWLSLRSHLGMHGSRQPKVVAGTAVGRICWQNLHHWLSKLRNWRL